MLNVLEIKKSKNSFRGSSFRGKGSNSDDDIHQKNLNDHEKNENDHQKNKSLSVDLSNNSLFMSNKNLLLTDTGLDESYKNTIYYPSSTKEWFNSVYRYNKSYIKSLISFDESLNNLFRSYFNIFIEIYKIFFKRRRTRRIRYSSNKVFVSKAELKHTNSKLTVILYIYNKRKLSIERGIRKALNFTRIIKILLGKKKINKKTHENKLVNMLTKRFFLLKEWKNISLNNTFNFFKLLPKLNKEYDYIKRNFHTKKNSFTNINSYSCLKIPLYLYRFLKKKLGWETKFYNYAKAINFNKSKFSNLFLNLMGLGIKSLIEKLYDNKVKIKLVELKSVHLNSDVFSSAVALKLRNRKNKAVRILRKAILQMVKIPRLHTLITFDDFIENINKNNILNVMKQQVVSGVRFEASGRLTRRLTAERAIFKVRYAGSLKNLRSSLNNIPSSLLRGHVKSNSQNTTINSKTRNGSFGLKTWVSSH